MSARPLAPAIAAAALTIAMLVPAHAAANPIESSGSTDAAAGPTSSSSQSSDSSVASAAPSDSSSSSSDSSTSVSASTESSAPATTSEPATTSAPATTSEPATTSAPATTAPATTTAPVTTPKQPDAPKTCTDTPKAAACIPDTAVKPAAQAPGAGTPLPFTGPGDVMAAVLLAMLAGTGGLMLLMVAGSREAIEGLSRRSMASPSGFKVAYRDLLKQQLGE